MIWPRLTVMLLTYAPSLDSPRSYYAHRTLRSTLDFLSYPGDVWVHIADDGSDPAHVASLRELAGGYAHVRGIGATNAERRGYGASYNLATQQVHIVPGLVLPLEDDWVLERVLDLEPYAHALIQPDSPVSCVRLGYIGYTQPLRSQIVDVASVRYLLFDPKSEERHVCAGHPRLETVAWEKRVGPWPEGLDPGTTEFVWCGFDEAREGVAWPLDTPAGGWYHHVGTVQARSDQGEGLSLSDVRG